MASTLQNVPLLLETFNQTKDEDLKLHFLMHCSVDVIEDRSRLFGECIRSNRV